MVNSLICSIMLSPYTPPRSRALWTQSIHTLLTLVGTHETDCAAPSVSNPPPPLAAQHIPKSGCAAMWLLEMGVDALGWISLSRSVQECLEVSSARWCQLQPLQSHSPGFKVRSSALPSCVDIHSSSMSLCLPICEGQGVAPASMGLCKD